MTAQDIITAKEKIEALKLSLVPLYTAQSDRHKLFNISLSEKLTNLVKPLHTIGVRLNMDNLEIFTVSVEPPYTDSGSTITLYNRYDYLDNTVPLENQFKPDLTCSGIRLSYNQTPTLFEITKIQLLHFMATELNNYHTENVGSSFIKELREMFKHLRVAYNAIKNIEREITTIKNGIYKFEEAQKLEIFISKIQVGQWLKLLHNPFNSDRKFNNYTVFMNIIKETDKTITLQVFRDDETPYSIGDKRVSKEEVASLLSGAVFLESSPIPSKA